MTMTTKKSTGRRGRGRLLAPVLCAAVTGGFVLAGAGVAGAATPSASSSVSHSGGADFKQLQKMLEEQLADRQHRLAGLSVEVSASRHLTDAHGATLESDLSAETSGINALAAKVPNDTTIAELTVDHETMIDYRVYVVMSPQVELTIAADTASGVEQAFEASESHIEALIRYEQSQGKDVHGAQIAFLDMVRQVANAEHDTTGVSDSVLAAKPSGWPANRTIFTNAASSLGQAKKALQTATADRTTIFRDLGLNG